MLAVTSLGPVLDKPKFLLGRAKMVMPNAGLRCHMSGSIHAFSDQSSWCMNGSDFRVSESLEFVPHKFQKLY